MKKQEEPKGRQRWIFSHIPNSFATDDPPRFYACHSLLREAERRRTCLTTRRKTTRAERRMTGRNFLFYRFYPTKNPNKFFLLYIYISHTSQLILRCTEIKHRMTQSRNWRWVCVSLGVYSYQEYLSYYVLWTVSTTFVPQSCSTTREETPVTQQIFHSTHKVWSKTY